MEKREFFQKMVGLIANVHVNTHAMKKDTRPDSVTPLQYSILEYVFFGSEVTISSIADCLYLSMPNASREVKKLVNLGYLIKQHCKDDKRKMVICFSTIGAEIMGNCFSQIEENFWVQTGELASEDMERLAEAADSLAQVVFSSKYP